MEHDADPSPEELSTIKVTDLLDLVKGDAEKYLPQLSDLASKTVFSSSLQDNAFENDVAPERYNLAHDRHRDGRQRQKGVSKAPDGNTYGNVQFEGKIKKWGEKQKADVAFLDFVAREFAGGVTVHVFDSFTSGGKRYYYDSKGKLHPAPNGKYMGVNGDIYLDLNAGDNGEGLVLNTFAHELYHHIEKWSPAKARELAQFLVKELGLDSVEAMVRKQIEKAQAAGYGVKYFMTQGMSRVQAYNTVRARAFSDFVADSLETVFTRGDALGVIQRLRKSDKGLFDRIKAFVDKWVSKLREFYRGDQTVTREGHNAAQLEKFEQIQELFMEALLNAGDNFRREAKSGDNSVANADEILYSKRYSKVFFKENVFPSYKESKSDTHELAERWSRADTTKTGDRKLISHHNVWYLIEAFEDMKYGYQIMEKIKKKDYEEKVKFYGTITRRESVQTGSSCIITRNRRSNRHGDAGYSLNSDVSEYRSEDSSIRRMDTKQTRWGDTESNGTRDPQGSNSDRRQPDGSAVDEKFSDRNPIHTSNRSLPDNAVEEDVISELFRLAYDLYRNERQ